MKARFALVAAQNPADREFLQPQINTTDHAIDQLVYELYDLAPDEIAIVEETTQ
jgi:hypothetical protein